jgi:hypothetical protein
MFRAYGAIHQTDTRHSRRLRGVCQTLVYKCTAEQLLLYCAVATNSSENIHVPAVGKCDSAAWKTAIARIPRARAGGIERYVVNSGTTPACLAADRWCQIVTNNSTVWLQVTPIMSSPESEDVARAFPAFVLFFDLRPPL